MNAWSHRQRAIARRVQRVRALCLLLCTAFCAALRAPIWAAPGDAPARNGRLSLWVGKVEAMVKGGAAWAPAVLNLPLGQMSRAAHGQGQLVGTKAPATSLSAGRQIGVNAIERSLSETSGTRETPFTEWAQKRARRKPNAQTLLYVSAEMTGAEEPDKHGSWITDPR